MDVLAGNNFYLRGMNTQQEIPQTTLVQVPQAAATAARLNKSYGDETNVVTALRNVNLSVAPGEFLAIMGPSGSGKSTLMHMMAGLDRPSSGQVYIGSEDLTQLPDKELTELRRDKIGFIFQSFNLLPTLDVRENIMMPFMLAGRKPTAVERQWADTLITRLGLASRVTHRPSQLSGGQQQRVAIARALVTKPVIVFADEPTGNLDSASSREVLELLRELVETVGQSIIMVTHDALAASRASRVVILSDGEIIQELHSADANEISSLMLSLEQRA